ncbi:MAG: thioesterase, partial [Chryseobacterium sp.]
AGKEDDIFRAESIMVNNTRKTAIYDIKITNQNEELIAKFVGTVYKIGKKVTEL